MTDTRRLHELIKSKGLKFSYIASRLGISPQAYYNKERNLSLFTSEEIKTLCDVLEITDLEEKEAIFFASELDLEARHEGSTT